MCIMLSVAICIVVHNFCCAHLQETDDFLLAFYVALAYANPKARVPYKCIKDSQVCRFPSGLSFDPPSSFSTSNLKIALDKANYISFCKFKDMSKNGVCVL